MIGTFANEVPKVSNKLTTITDIDIFDKDDKITKASFQMSELTPSNVKDLFMSVQEDIDFNYFKLGGILHTIKSNKWYGDSFPDYITETLGLNLAKAYHLINIYTHLVSSGLSWENVKHIGWTKMRVISPLLKENNKDVQDEWLKKADQMTQVQLQQNVKELKQGKGYTKAEQDAEKWHTLTFRLPDEHKNVILSAIRSSKKVMGTEHDFIALEVICQSYLYDTFKPIDTKVYLTETMRNRGSEEVLAIFKEVFPEIKLDIS